MTNEQIYAKANNITMGDVPHQSLMISMSKCYKAMDLLREEALESINIKDIENFLRKKKLKKLKKI